MKSRFSPNSRPGSLFLVAILASGLQLMIQANMGLQVPVVSTGSPSDYRHESEMTSDDNDNNSLNFDGGEILLSDEFYFYRPDKEFVPQSLPSGNAAFVVDEAPGQSTTTTKTQDGSIRPNKTICQPEVGSNPAVGHNSTQFSCDDATAGSVPNKSGTQKPSSSASATNTTTTRSDVADKPTGNIGNNIGQDKNNASIRANSNSGSGSFSSGKQNNKMFGKEQTPYCLGNRDEEGYFNWLCQGLTLVRAPLELIPKPAILRLSNTGIETLTSQSLQNYRNTLRDFSMENAPRLVTIEKKTFSELTKLRVVYILKAPKLVSFDHALSGPHPDMMFIRIQQTGLRSWPNLSRFQQERILSSLDLDNNRIETLSQEPMNIRTETLNLGFNLISSIDEFTFNGSEIGTLLFCGNRQLSFIHPNAFANLKNLITLDLSSTSLVQLPTVGLHQLRTLIMEDAYTLKRIPSIYVFPLLAKAQLTYAYHCCSFRYPQTHDPSGYEGYLRLQEDLNEICANRDNMTPAEANQDKPGQAHQQDQQSPTPGPQTTTQSQSDGGWEGVFYEERKVGVVVLTQQTPLLEAPNKLEHQKQAQPRHPEVVVAGDRKSDQLNAWQLMHYIECGELTINYTKITCTPIPDAFNPCEDIMGYSVLRVAVWFVVGASVFGNLSVIVVLTSVFRRLSVPKFLQLNLAIGDLMMGIYLAMLALADLTTVGSYFNYAIDWQHGYGCKVAGAASLFASQLSIFTLCVITIERYYTITNSIDLNMRLQLGWATRIMILGWLFAFASAMLPIFADISSYTKTSICLPMRTNNLLDHAFLTVLLLIDSSAFVIIFACYLRMYLLIIRQKTEATAKERRIAMRMSLLVFTDFACWAPIIFFGATALFGTPLISVTNSKILIVFFYPLNSMANPFLYVISTRQYHRDLNYLTGRWEVWRKNLFNRNHDSYYSNNAAYGAAQYTGSALNAHLGAVAAVTGVAQHHQLRQTTANLNGGLKLTEQRGVVCTKSHRGRYIIRHQILHDQEGLRRSTRAAPAACQLQALTVAAGGGNKSDANNVTGALTRGSGAGQASCASKLVNLSAKLDTDLEGAGAGAGGTSTKGPSTGGGYMMIKDACPGSKKKSVAHWRQRSTKYSCGDKLVDRCNCCCRCYRWSGTSSRAHQIDEHQQPQGTAPETRQPVMGLEANSTTLREMKSITLLTSLPNTSSNHSDSNVAPECVQMAQNDHKRDKTICSHNKTTTTPTVPKSAGRVLRRKCSCLVVDELFREAVTNEQVGADEPKCAHHDDSGGQQQLNSCEPSDIDILGNISYNEPTSTSPSGISSPQSIKPIIGLDSRACHHLHQVSRRGSANGSQCKCGRKFPRRDHNQCQDRADNLEAEEGDASGLSESNTNLFSGSIEPVHTSDTSTAAAHLNNKQNRHRHCHCHHHSHHRHHHRRHHHHHHHHRHHHGHRNQAPSPGRDSHDTRQSDDNIGRQYLDNGQGITWHSAARLYGRDLHVYNNDEAHRQLPDDDQLIACSGATKVELMPDAPLAAGGGGSVAGEHRLESILKQPSKEIVSKSNKRGSAGSGGRWSPMIRLLRGGSFQSSTRMKDKKRVSIVDHHSG